jgi:hypothetical protein
MSAIQTRVVSAPQDVSWLRAEPGARRAKWPRTARQYRAAAGGRREMGHEGGPGRLSSWTTDTTSSAAATPSKP